MTTLELTLDLPDSLARDAEAEGLLTSPALAKLLKEGIARRAAERLLASAARASAAGSKPMSKMGADMYWDIAIMPDGYPEITVCYADYPKH